MMNNEQDRIVPMRLQRFLARAGVASRRGSENLMTSGRVTVNGIIASELGFKVDPLKDQVAVDGRLIHLADGPITLMLHKPAGVITTMRAQSDKPIVAQLVPIREYPGLFPIGRLDADTTGLLLFSTDGNLGNSLLHPRFHVEKTYVAQLDEPISAPALQMLRTGVPLQRKSGDRYVDDGVSAPAEAELLSTQDPADQGRIVRLTIHEGRYHQVKRMFSAVGRTVVGLHRESFGPLSLGNLPCGEWRLLSPEEMGLLRQC